MKKKLLILVPLLIAVLTFIGVYFYYTIEDQNTSLTIPEKRWLEKNNSEKINLEVINDIPLFGMNGNGIIFYFLEDFQDTTKIEFNKLPYSKTEKPNSNGYRFRILNNEENLSNKDLLLAVDDYIALSKDNIKYNNIESIQNKTIGVLNNDISELTYYLKSGVNVTLKSYSTIDELTNDLNNNKINMIIIPKITYLDKIIANNQYFINYTFTEIGKKIVLTLSDDNIKLNEIITKYFNKWKKSFYVSSYNKMYFNYYVDTNKINDKTKADLISKNYVYGFVENAPFETIVDEELVGIAGEYIARMKRLTGIDFIYQSYKNQEELKNAIAKGEVDIYFSYDGTKNNMYLETSSPFVEEYVVLSKVRSNQVVRSFESLKGQKVNMLKNDALFNYFKDNSRANIQEVTSVDKLTNNDNIVIIDKEIYSYYRNTTFSGYEVLYQNYMTNEYKFMIKNDNNNFYKLFNHIINSNSYFKYRNSGLINLDLSLIERSSFEQLYIIILVTLLTPLAIGILGYFLIKKKKEVKEVKKEDRRKYTDLLTSLKNRNYLTASIEAWETTKVYPQTIAIVDLNNVKYVNDNYGHAAGDELIIKAASILVNNQLENSEIIRTDGNEFLLYLVGYSESQIGTYCKKLIKEFKELPHGFGASIGCSMILDDIKTIDDAINEATLDMRNNKENNK